MEFDRQELKQEVHELAQETERRRKPMDTNVQAKLESITKELENLNIQAEALNLHPDSLSSDDLTDMLTEFCAKALYIYIAGRSILTDVRPDEGGGSYVS